MRFHLRLAKATLAATPCPWTNYGLCCSHLVGSNLDLRLFHPSVWSWPASHARLINTCLTRLPDGRLISVWSKENCFRVPINRATDMWFTFIHHFFLFFFFAISLLSHSLCLVDNVEQDAWGKVKTVLWPWEYSHSKGALMKENESEDEGQAWSNESRWWWTW